ncbi:hypothetical protein Tco_0151802 [Tanacetum coccineum]
MSNQSEDIQAAGSDTRPPMLDRTDFESWQQRIRLYYKDKDHGEYILQSIDEGPFKMGRCRDEIASGTDAPYLGLERDRVGLPRDIYKLINHNTDAKDIWDNVKMLLEGFELTKDDRESQLYDEFEHFRQHKGENIHDYYIRTSSNTRNQATVQNGRVMVQNVQGRQNRVQGNNARGAIAARNEGAQNRAGNANAGQENPIKCYNYNGISQENGVDLDEEQLLFLAGGQTNTFDDDVDEGPVQDMAQQEDNIFQSDQFYDEVGPLHDSDTLSEVQDHDNGLDNVNESHEEHKMHNVVQQNDVGDSDTKYISNSNIISYEQYLQDNEDRVVYSDVSSVPNDAIMIITNDIYEQDTQCVTFEMPNIPINASLTAELARYKVAIGYKNPFYLSKAKQVQPALYSGQEIVKPNHARVLVHDSEDTLEIAETTRKQMNEK